jgi:effector-binding domain-containing protein
MKTTFRPGARVISFARRMLLTAVTLIFTAACSVFGVESVEQASYTVVKKDGDFEIRDYDPMVVVETRVDANFRKAGNAAFKKLFAYISGENTGTEEIAMTAPVVAAQDDSSDGEKIAMTAPVTASSEGNAWVYRFVLPQSYQIETAPRPLDPEVELLEVPARRVAAIRFSGRSTEKARQQKTEELKEWLSSAGIEAASDARWAGYNSPWALPPFRRNEVLVDVDE